jgi:hypothetical protein
VELKIMDRMDVQKTEMTQQERWDMIVDANRKTAEEMLSKSGNRHGTNNNEIICRLSKEQKKLGEDINATQDQEVRKVQKRKRNEMIGQVHRLIAEQRHHNTMVQVENIEKLKNDSNKMFQAVRATQRMDTKKPLQVNTDSGITTSTEKQIEIVTRHFQQALTTDTSGERVDIPPTKMESPFTPEEIAKAVKSLKTGKSPGVDNIHTEQLKCSPTTALEDIAHILNKTAEFGVYPRILTHGLLIPLQKPGKKKGPPENLRPIILLSILRKITAICLINRIGEKIDNSIPLTQAAYRSGRSTTEQVFSLKIMAEKAITSVAYNTHILMMDMSKAFDTISRNTLLKDLKKILNPDELHVVKVLLTDVQLSVRIDKTIGKPFTTNVGTPQGDSLSPILFTLYLARALRPDPTETHMVDHNYSEDPHQQCLLPQQLQEHSYSGQVKSGMKIELQYADDISWVVANGDHLVEELKKDIPVRLEKRKLIINTQKTEEYSISRGGMEEM